MSISQDTASTDSDRAEVEEEEEEGSSKSTGLLSLTYAHCTKLFYSENVLKGNFNKVSPGRISDFLSLNAWFCKISLSVKHILLDCPAFNVCRKLFYEVNSLKEFNII